MFTMFSKFTVVTQGYQPFPKCQKSENTNTHLSRKAPFTHYQNHTYIHFGKG